jgi:DNA repair protein RecO (recombination protein O)
LLTTLKITLRSLRPLRLANYFSKYRMPLQKTEAVVLKTQRSGETSKIITLYSPKFGKIKVVAKGSRGLKSRFFGSLEPLNHVSVVYYFKATREYQFLSQADIIHAYDKLKADLNKYATATVFCDLIDRTELEQANPYLFQILVDVLGGINQTQQNLINYYFWFLLRFLKINGFTPDFTRCKICQTNYPQYQARFSLVNGSFSCDKCSLQEPMAVTVSAATIQYLRKLQETSVKNLDSIAITTDKECEMLLLAFLQYHIEETKYLKSLKFLNQMRIR